MKVPSLRIACIALIVLCALWLSYKHIVVRVVRAHISQSPSATLSFATPGVKAWVTLDKATRDFDILKQVLLNGATAYELRINAEPTLPIGVELFQGHLAKEHFYIYKNNGLVFADFGHLRWEIPSGDYSKLRAAIAPISSGELSGIWQGHGNPKVLVLQSNRQFYAIGEVHQELTFIPGEMVPSQDITGQWTIERTNNAFAVNCYVVSVHGKLVRARADDVPTWRLLVSKNRSLSPTLEIMGGNDLDFLNKESP